MDLLLKIFSLFFNKSVSEKSVDNRYSYIFYRIIDFNNESDTYLIQCINTKAVFQAKLYQIVCDLDILYGLDPLQACFIGIEFAKFIRRNENNNEIVKLKKVQAFLPESRYGSYEIHYLNRKGDLFFTNKKTKEEFLMNPKDISLSKKLIEEFDASHSYFIGLQAGIKIKNPKQITSNNKKFNLYVVK